MGSTGTEGQKQQSVRSSLRDACTLGALAVLLSNTLGALEKCWEGVTLASWMSTPGYVATRLPTAQTEP